MVAFDRPVGAPADVQELEYVSALHQTAAVARTDGSINDEDIMLYLRSRFGLELSKEEVRNTILQGMGGSADDGEVIDLMEMMAILFIPYLNKAAMVQRGEDLPEGVVQPSGDVLKQVLEMIMHDVILNGGDDDDDEDDDTAAKDGGDDDSPKAPKISAKLVKRILNAYGEHDSANNDELVEKMVQQMQGHERLTVDAFAQALTQDVRLYDLSNETRYTNTYQDIMDRDPHRDMFDHDDVEDLKHNIAANGGGGDGIVPDKTEVFEDEFKSGYEVMDEETQLLVTKKKEDLPEAPQVTKRYTAPAIDSTNGTYRSKTLIVVLWAGVLFNYIAFTAETGEDGTVVECPPFIPDGEWEVNFPIMKCNIYLSVAKWLWVFFVLCIFGMVYIGCGSFGNADGNKRSWKPMFAMAFLFFFSIVPNVTLEEERITGSQRYVRLVAIMLASIAMLLHFLHFCYLWTCHLDCKRKLNELVNVDEANMKSSIAFKINRLVSNAIEIHHTSDQQNIVKSCFGYALHVFSKWTKTERVGGNIWVWQNVWDNTISSREGLWYSARLSAANLCQYIVVFYLVFYFIHVHYTVMDNFNKEDTKASLRGYLQYLISTHVSEERVAAMSENISVVVSAFLTKLEESGIAEFKCSEVVTSKVEEITAFTAACPDFIDCSFDLAGADVALCSLIEMPDLSGLEQLALMASAGLDLQSLVDSVHAGLAATLDQTVDAFYPNTMRMVTTPVTLGALAACLTTFWLAISYFPSVTSTTLQLRSGVIPLLGDKKKLNIYRAGPDTVTTLTGALFWGCLFSGIIVGGVVGVVSFFVLWQKSVAQTQKSLAMITGIVVIAGIRTLIMQCGRSSYFQSFYRKKPAAANIYFLAMEWANFALSAGFIFVRGVQLLVAAAMNVGRIDAPFLAKGVGKIGPVDLDPFPTIHMRDILATEAHRHPYIELMGKVYLMKLRYGPLFSNNAGSCWRLLFVYALMPWMQKYRIFDSTTPEEEVDDGENKGETHKHKVLATATKRAGGKSLTSVKALQSENDALRKRVQELEDQMTGLEKKIEGKGGKGWFA